MSDDSLFYQLYLRQIYNEAYLDRYVSFSAFRNAPEDWLLLLGQYDAVVIMGNGFRPLLPIQVRLRQELEAQWRKQGVWDETMRLTQPSTPNATGESR